MLVFPTQKRHGSAWKAMLMLIVGGVMSLPWIAALAAYVLIEKTYNPAKSC